MYGIPLASHKIGAFNRLKVPTGTRLLTSLQAYQYPQSNLGLGLIQTNTPRRMAIMSPARYIVVQVQ
eukprot:COSAG02_NODE_37477_length_441_cov_1.078947_1_plen_66_part_10